MSFTLTGTLDARQDPGRVRKAQDPGRVRKALDAHIEASRAEPGCLSFDVREDEDQEGLFHVEEAFVDAEAFQDHQTRTRNSDWWEATKGFPREYKTVDDIA